MSRELIDRAAGKWKFILAELGIDQSFLTGKRGPCPICGGKDRFRFDDKNGSGSWICNHCGSGYGVHLHQKLHDLTLGEALSDVEKLIATAPAAPVKSSSSRTDFEKARETWLQTAPMGSGIMRYLERTRGISPVVIGKMRSVRQFDRLLYLDDDGNFCGRFTAMVGLIQSPDGKGWGVHRTYLGGGGLQAPVPTPKKVLGSVPEGAAIRLFDHEGVLGVAEGIETALSAMQLFGVPTWATINFVGLEKWIPPDRVTSVVVFGDNDRSFTGQTAAYALARKLKAKGLPVSVQIPVTPGHDWNDELRGAA
jgi:putative DNA primase/helicase